MGSKGKHYFDSLFSWLSPHGFAIDTILQCRDCFNSPMWEQLNLLQELGTHHKVAIVQGCNCTMFIGSMV